MGKYLTLRGLELVQVYFEARSGPHDVAMAQVLGVERHQDLRLADRLIDMRFEDHGGVHIQVWGARHVAGPATLPISNDPLDKEWLVWPGLSGAITNDVAAAFGPSTTSMCAIQCWQPTRSAGLSSQF